MLFELLLRDDDILDSFRSTPSPSSFALGQAEVSRELIFSGSVRVHNRIDIRLILLSLDHQVTEPLLTKLFVDSTLLYDLCKNLLLLVRRELTKLHQG